MVVNKKKWYAVYTRPRWEKKVFGRLQESGIEVYCPFNKVRKKWSDRIKLVEEPLFKSYLFVRIAEEEQPAVRMASGVVNFVYWLGKPAIVRDKDIETIRKFLHEYENVQAVPLELTAGTKVKIRQGVFMDKEARVLRTQHKKIQVIIESIGYSLVAIVDKSNLAMI